MDGFEWDETKRGTNLRKHGLDFRDGIDLFDGRPTLNVNTHPGTELRFRTTALEGGVFYTLIWTPRSGNRRFISFRRARDEEKRDYRQLHR